MNAMKNQELRAEFAAFLEKKRQERAVFKARIHQDYKPDSADTALLVLPRGIISDKRSESLSDCKDSRGFPALGHLQARTGEETIPPPPVVIGTPSKARVKGPAGNEYKEN